MADNQVSNDIQWTKIQNAIRGRDKQGPAADQASKLLAANSLVRENGKGTYSAQDIRSLANKIDANNDLGADNGYMPGDFLNGIYSGFGGAIDDFWDRTVGKIAPTAADWFSGEDIGSALDIASDIGLSLIPGVGLPLVVGKNLLQNTRNFSDAIRGYNSTTGQYMTPDQQAMKLFGTAGTVAMSALPFGLGKIGKAGKAGAKAIEEESSRLGKLADDLKISKDKNPLPDDVIATMAPAPEKGGFALSEEQIAKGRGSLPDDVIADLAPAPSNLVSYSPYPVSASTEVVPLDKSFLKKVGGKFKAGGEAKKEFTTARDNVPIYENSLEKAQKELTALEDAEAAEADAAAITAKRAEIAKLEGQLEEAKAIEAYGSKRKYKKATTGSRGARDNILSGFGGKRTNRMNTAIDNLGYRKDMTSLEYLDDLVKNDAKTAINLYNTTENAATKNLLKTVFDSNFEKGAMEAASKAAKSGASAAKADRTFKEVLQGLPGNAPKGKLPDWRYGSDRGINAAILGSGLATQAANMYGNGADPITAFIDNPDRVIANIIASAAFRKPTVNTIASRTPRFYNTAQRSAANAQRMNYLNRLAQDQYGLDQELTDDQIADLISGQAYQDQLNRTLSNDLLRQVYGYARR